MTPEQLGIARTFLSRVLPFPPLAPEGSWYNLHWYVRIPGKDKPGLQGMAFPTLEEMLGQLVYRSQRDDALGIAYCVSSQSMMVEEAKKQGGGTWRRALRNRDNATYMREIFVDVDVNPDPKKGYPDLRSALVAKNEFVARRLGGRQPNLVVQSGGGLHLHWTFDRALTIDEWKPLAQAFNNAAQRDGFVIDAQDTVDPARMPRIPGTWNRKRDTPALVTVSDKGRPDYTYDDMRFALADYAGAEVITLPGAGASALPAGSMEVDLDVAGEKGCGLIANALATAGASLKTQTQWNLLTLAATWSAGDGRVDAHRMASGNPHYVAADTDDLYDRKLKERTEQDLGWPKCSTFENAGSAECATCPLRPLDKSPLNLGRVVIQPTAFATSAQDEDVPHGYRRRQDGVIVKQGLTEKGELVETAISPYPFEGGRITDNPFTIHCMTRYDNRPVALSVLFTDVASRDKFAAVLGKHGITHNRAQAPLVQDFMATYIQKVQSLPGRTVTAKAFGWSVTNAQPDGFCFDGVVFSSAGERPATTEQGPLGAIYKPKGDIARWMDASRLVTDQRRPALDAILATAFAGPLVRFTGHRGLLVTAVSSGTGIGKSTAMRAAQAVWGDPVAGMNKVDDTLNSALKKLGKLSALPAYWDEIRGEDAVKNFQVLAFTLAEGREKSRLNQASEQQATGTWETMLVGAANDSILDIVSSATKTTNAGMVRVFEFKVPGTNTGDVGAANRILANLHDNHGHAGRRYAEFLGNNVGRIATDVALMTDNLTEEHAAPADERFWIGSMATILQGATYANELELADFDLPALKAFLGDTLAVLRGEKDASPTDMTKVDNVGALLSRFLADCQPRHLLVTQNMAIGPGKPPKLEPVNDMTKFDGLWAHYGIGPSMLRVSNARFRAWLEKHGYSPSQIIEAVKAQMGGRLYVGILGGGTVYGAPIGKDWVLEIEATGELADQVNTGPATAVPNKSTTLKETQDDAWDSYIQF